MRGIRDRYGYKKRGEERKYARRDKQITEPAGSNPVPEIMLFFNVGAREHQDAVES
jgi:hypothetical protein